MNSPRTPCSRHDYEDTAGFHPCCDEDYYTMTDEDWEEYYETANDSKGG